MTTPIQRIAESLFPARGLLPANSTPLERAMLAAEMARFAEVDPEIVATIWNPYLCPPPLLPFLAWALSVDVWDNSWPNEVKRDVIAASPEVHRRKGTRASVDRALRAMRLRAAVKEWWQKVPNGQRGTFDVTVFVTEHVYAPALPILSEQVQRNAIGTIRATKPKSRAMSFSMGVGFEAAAGAANRLAGFAIENRPAFADVDTRKANPLSAANSGAAIQIDNRTLLGLPDLSRRNAFLAANRSAAMQFQRFTFEVQA